MAATGPDNDLQASAKIQACSVQVSAAVADGRDQSQAASLQAPHKAVRSCTPLHPDSSMVMRKVLHTPSYLQSRPGKLLRP